MLLEAHVNEVPAEPVSVWLTVLLSKAVSMIVGRVKERSTHLVRCPAPKQRFSLLLGPVPERSPWCLAIRRGHAQAHNASGIFQCGPDLL